MPRWSQTIRHVAPDGSVVTGIVCGRSRYRKCSVPDCRRHAEFQCDFPVARKGRKSTTCDRWICSAHRKNVGPDRDYCPPHVRVEALLPAASREALGDAELAGETLPLPGFDPIE